MSNKIYIDHVLENTIQRGLVLEQKTASVIQSIPLADLVPAEAKGRYGTFKITIEFEPKKEEG